MTTARKHELMEVSRHKSGIMTCQFDQIESPGIYIENKTGTLFRIPDDALAPGRSPVIEVLNEEPWVVTKISDDPYMPLTKARMVAADLDLPVNF